MFFRVKSSSPDVDLAIYRAKRKAMLALTLYKFGVTEVLLSRYLQEKYNIPLRKACLLILQNSTYHINFKQEIIVTIKEPKLNELANIITFGTGRLMGSDILKVMLSIN
jgi:hypothetical protein